MSNQTLSKVFFPTAGDPDVVPLYLDADEWTEVREERRPIAEAVRHRRGPVPNEVHSTPLRISHVNATGYITGRRSLRIPANERVSLGTYFNAFPASYWQRWTTLDRVVLRVVTRGRGDVTVYRSNARGVVQTVDSASLSGDGRHTFELPLGKFIDGGWYWFDLTASDEDFELIEADWAAPEGVAPNRDGRITVSITTLNRTAYCLELLAAIAGDADALEGIDQILVVDQGTQLLRDAQGFESVEASLDGRLRVIEQANVGGSGGFSRGMLETLDAGTSDYVLLLDDDVAVEPESIRRMRSFASYTAEPTIVGGHMFDMYDKTKLHAYAERVDRWSFMWGPITPDRHDFTSSNLRQTKWMHRRFDVDYNGWWMSLIPVPIIREIGLSLPVFIKWDDAEFSLRAASRGYSTVTMPGAAIWHVSWVDKDDSRDWQAFFHARNRLIAAMLHSPHRRGGRLPVSNLASDVRHVLTLDYYAVALRQLAYESVLRGPEALHGEMKTRLPQLRALAPRFRETELHRNPEDVEHFPQTAYFGDDPAADGSKPSGLSAYRFVVREVWSHWFDKSDAGASPSVHLPHGTPWWKLTALRNFAQSNAEGSGFAWHVHDRKKFRKLLVSSVRYGLRIRRQWPELSGRYREQLWDLTSIARWRDSLGVTPGGSAVEAAPVTPVPEDAATPRTR
ncbi:glycosyltransferase [Agromyces sp. NBRC 114283]|uniref:glycosyltransferase n=1 Tax=Agromyces sp. NBRC 114283 TaxID=2994521 RepID=UPI0024A33023|nr:glycosyltransferase [Agromyces sp. NBRC 114283]GLU90650.1 glycosyl transferase [Agromyces sp. NBRC 114283]